MANVDVGTDTNSTITEAVPNQGKKLIYFEIASGTDINSDDTLTFSDYQAFHFGLMYATNSNSNDVQALFPTASKSNTADIVSVTDQAATGNFSGGVVGFAFVSETTPTSSAV